MECGHASMEFSLVNLVILTFFVLVFVCFCFVLVVVAVVVQTV